MTEGHIDLFSGIGGFTLACQWAGIKTEVFCESDKRCQDFLKRTYPDVPIISDIREFDGTRWRGRFLLTGGVPCQPASRAGKQGGQGDDRWMWPEALRVVSEARPDWVLFENPPGINDVGLGGILADLEALGYEIAPPLIIPACSVNSPQLRARYWIVAHSVMRGSEIIGRPESDTGLFRRKSGDLSATLSESSQGDVADTGEQCSGSRGTKPEGFERKNEVTELNGDVADTPQDDDRRSDTGESERQVYEFRGGDGSFWSNSIWLPCADGKLRRSVGDSQRMAHGLPVELLEELGTEGRQTPKECEVHRSILAALGNSIVWPVAAQIIKAIVEASDGCD